jgi:hypothetical protein
VISRDWFAAAVASVLPPDHGLVPLGRLNPDPKGTSGSIKVYFGARCTCTTAAVLSVEASASKTQTEVESALPSIIGKLLAQRDAFLRMPCSVHRRLRGVRADSTTEGFRVPGE